MTEETSSAEPAGYIVVCGTCDNVFRVHPGRPTCPACGGDPDYVLMALEPQPGAEEETMSEQQEGGDAPSQEIPPPPSPAAGEPEGEPESGDESGEKPGSPAEDEGS